MKIAINTPYRSVSLVRLLEVLEENLESCKYLLKLEPSHFLVFNAFALGSYRNIRDAKNNMIVEVIVSICKEDDWVETVRSVRNKNRTLSWQIIKNVDFQIQMHKNCWKLLHKNELTELDIEELRKYIIDKLKP